MSSSRLLLVVAHPDDETFGCGALLLHAKARGAHVTVACATRGEAGADDPNDEQLGRVREGELRAAAEVLGVDEVVLLGFVDSGMAGPAAPKTLVGADFDVTVAAVSGVIDSARPDVVVTLDASDGHRDHARIRDATLEAARARGIDTVYLSCLPRSLMQRWMDDMAGLSPGKEHLRAEPTSLGTPDVDLTTLVDAAPYLEVWERAMIEHASQDSPYDGLGDGLRAEFLGTIRARRLVPPWLDGHPPETELPL